MILLNSNSEVGTVNRQAAIFRDRTDREHEVFMVTEKGLSLPAHSDHWFLLGASLAFLLQEDYEQEAPVCEKLLANFRESMKLWYRWYPEKQEIRIDVPIESRTDARANSMGSFFSGGIDSLFTTTMRGEEVEALISIAHTPEEKWVGSEMQRLDELTRYAETTGRRHLRVATNMMTETEEFYDAWHRLTHGPALAAVAHFLSSEVDRVIISSSHQKDDAIPLGSHPDIDHLFSSGQLEMIHFGEDHAREEKTEVISRDQKALAILSVCGKGRQSGPYPNCSKCSKCLRTMITLDMLGIAPEQAKTFDWTDYSPQSYAKLFLRKEGDYIYSQGIAEQARLRGRDDIVVAVNRAISRSRPFRWLVSAEMQLRRRTKLTARHRNLLLAARAVTYGVLGLRK